MATTTSNLVIYNLAAFCNWITHKSGCHSSTSTCCKPSNNRELTILTLKEFLNIQKKRYIKYVNKIKYKCIYSCAKIFSTDTTL